MKESNKKFVAMLLFFGWAALLPHIRFCQAAGGGDLSGVAGIVVDPNGVLQLRTFEDPNGQLMRSRIDAAKAALPQDMRRRSAMRKISLNRLEKALGESISNNRPPEDAMRYLAGLTRLEYVFYYPENPDIVIAGPAYGWGVDESVSHVGPHMA